MTHCLWSTLLGLLSVLSAATSRSVRQLPSAYPPVLPTGYYGQPPYAYPHYGYGYQAPPPVYQPYYDNVFGFFKSYPGGGFPVRFDYNNRCSRNYIGIKPHPDQQQYYYVCKPDCVIFSKCRSLESFDASSGRCVQHVPQHRPDHRPPQCEKEGRFPHPHDCKVYYRCDKNRTQPWLFACPAGTIFSPVERKCLPGDQCPSTEISDSGSYIPQNCELKFPECAEEGTFRSPTDCALYYTCRLQASGTYLQTRFKCPGSNSFDIERKLCRPRSEVDCFDFVPGPVQVPYAPQPYYPPYPAAPPLYEEDDYDTEAREQQPALKSEKLQLTAQAFERPSLNVVELPKTAEPTPVSAYHKYPAYPSYHRGKETAAENIEVEEEGVPRKLQLSENIAIVPEDTATREPLKDTSNYQYKRYTYGTDKNDVTEAPELKSPLKGLHLSQNIVVLSTEPTNPTTPTTTTSKPAVHTCPTIATQGTTPKPSTTTTVRNTTPIISSTEPHSTASAKPTTGRPTTVTEKTSPATEKPKTTTVTSTTHKRSTTTHNTSHKTSTASSTTKNTTTSPRTTKNTKKPHSTTPKFSTTTQKRTTTTHKSTAATTTTEKPKSTTEKTSTAATTTKKSTESSPKPSSTTEKTSTTPKLSTTTTPTTTTVTSTTPITTITASRSSTESTSTQHPTTTTTQPTTTTTAKSTPTKKPTTIAPKSSTTTTTTEKPTTTTTTTSTTTEKTTPTAPTSTKFTTTTQKPATITPKTTSIQHSTTTTPQPTKKTTRKSTTTPQPTTIAPKPSTTTTTTKQPTTTTTAIPATTAQKTTTHKRETTPQKTSTRTPTSKTTTTKNPEPTTPKRTTPKTSPSTERTTISTSKPTTEKSTENPTTTSVKTSALPSSTQKPTSITSESTTTTQKTTTTTPKPTTLKTSTQEPISSTHEASTVSTTTKKATDSSLIPTLSTEKPTTTPKPLTTPTPTTTVTSTTPITTTTISESSTESTSSPKPESTTPRPTKTTTAKTTTVTISTQNPITSSPKTSSATIPTPKPSSSTQRPTPTTRQPTSVTSPTTSIGTTKIPTTTTPEVSTASTAVTTVTRPPCPDPDSTTDQNTNPACTQKNQQLNLLELQSPQKQEKLIHTQTNTAFTGSRNTLGGQEVPDYMDDAPSSADAESGQATTARAPTMSTLAAAHLLQKLFHIISTTPPSKEHAPTERPSSQLSSSPRPRGVTIAQMARHNLATSKPFIAHSLRLSIQQLASTQKRSIQPKALVTHNTTKKEPEDSEYYDSETSEQYADEDNEQLDKTQPRAMSSTTVPAVIPAAPSTTTEPQAHESTSVPSSTKPAPSTIAQPIESTTGEPDYGDSSAGSDYVNDVNDISSGVVTSLEARKNFLLSLLKQRLTHTEVKKPSPAMTTSTTTGAPQTSSSSKSPASTTSESTVSPTSSTARPALTASKHLRPEALSQRQKSSTPLSAEYYDEDDDYMEDEPAASSDADQKERGAVLVGDKPPAATAKRHVALPSAQPLKQTMLNILATKSEANEVEVKAASDGLQFRKLGSKNSQNPTESPTNSSSVVAEALSRRLAAKFGQPSGPNVPHTSDPKPTDSVMQTTIQSRVPQTESSSQTPPSTSAATPATQKHRTGKSGKQKPESIAQSTQEIVTQTTPESAPPATATATATPVPVAVRQEVLSVNSRPWLLAARNQTVHLTPISSISSISAAARAPSNPVSLANRSFNPLVSSPEDHSTEKVPQLIVKVYEPIDLKIVFCPKSCDQDHDHKFDPADNIKTSNCTGGCDEEEERIHKHVDIQWKPLELTDIAGFRNAA
ncbi:mucin-2 isoform X1 [Drosophila yakuba]|uniref:mucin-2 isoform X1 n=1 Tax=Drosophila yakuba TaxID=7245 RepID=UPI0019307B22|nr:mucin-2 isoform X1 [Drosophila yakuba]XP_039227116.1 mucin-2 isoform X1 [Drosophila yakuba]